MQQAKLPEDHIRLVTHNIRRLSFCTDKNFDDLFQEGSIGLIKACRQYDGRWEGRSFYLYASKYIQGYARHYLRSQIGRTDNGRNAIKPHANACSLETVPETPFYDDDPAVDEWALMKAVWNSHWEKEETERRCLELVFLEGLQRKEAAEILGLYPMKVTRIIKNGLHHLLQAYLSNIP